MRQLVLVLLLLLGGPGWVLADDVQNSSGAIRENPYPQPHVRQDERRRMVETIIRYPGPFEVTDERVIAALRRVPRHRFVPPAEQAHAYRNSPVSIGHGQTISQPYVVALMTQLADVPSGARVLEVGTGSGYQAAILWELTAQVFTIEIIAPLAARAKRLFAELGLAGIKAKEGDGYYGWAPDAAFDRILVTAAAGHIPPSLLRQLKPGGRMVIPVGPKWGHQELLLVTKSDNGGIRTRSILPVRFVPLTGGR